MRVRHILTDELEHKYDILVCLSQEGFRSFHLDNKAKPFNSKGQATHFDVVVLNDFEVEIKSEISHASSINFTKIFRKLMCKVCGQEYRAALDEFLKDKTKIIL